MSIANAASLTAKASGLRPSLPGPGLRVVLVKVGEEELASAGLPALTGQVHGLGTIDSSGGESSREYY